MGHSTNTNTNTSTNTNTNTSTGPGAGPGPVVAVGSRSVVRAWADGRVAKVPKPGVPPSWIRGEAEYTDAVWQLGVATHQSFGTEQLDGTVISIYQRVDGPTLWAMIAAEPSAASGYGALLARLHAGILALAPPVTLPRQADRLRCKLRQACGALGLAPRAAIDALPVLAPRLRLCHGDFHPGNVIMSARGPVVVDWFDASRGQAVGDIARTSLLLGAGQDNTDQVEHLPGHTPGLLRQIHDAYLATVCGLLGIEPALVTRWRRVEAVARLAEGVPPGALLALWKS